MGPDGVQHRRPLWIGLALAALTPVLVPVLPLLVASFFDPGTLFITVVVGAYALAISTLSTLLFALPLVLILRKIGRLRAVYVCPGAMLVGSLAMGYTTFSLSWFPQAPDNSETVEKGLNGLALGAAFGLIAGVALSLGAGIPFKRRQASQSA